MPTSSVSLIMGYVIGCFGCHVNNEGIYDLWSLTASAVSSRAWILHLSSSQPSLFPHDYEMVLRVSVAVCFLAPVPVRSREEDTPASPQPQVCQSSLQLCSSEDRMVSPGQEPGAARVFFPRPAAAASPPPELGTQRWGPAMTLFLFFFFF